MRERITTRISPDFLDTIGRSFKFRHGKGIAEWLKNSLDAYLRAAARGHESRTGGWPVILWLMNGGKGRTGPNLAVIDFSGASFEEVDKFFLHWGDTTASTHGGDVRTGGLTGGHGNGGKFYMREMWKNGARFLTWRNDRLSSLVVEREKDGTTGYWENKNERQSDWRRAFRIAFPAEDGLLSPSVILDHLETAEPELVMELGDRRRGLSVVVGRTAKQVLSSNDLVAGKKWSVQRLIDAICDASQARRPIRELRIAIFVDGELKLKELSVVAPPDDPEWPKKTFDLPGRIIDVDRASIGRLILQKTSEQLVGRLRDRNGVLVVDRRGNPIGWYPMSELAVPAVPAGRFIHGELMLDFIGLEDIVQNDRERLIGSERTSRILQEISELISNQLSEIEKAERDREKSSQLDSAAILNDSLNKHARRFLEKLESDIFADFIEDSEGGGPGAEGAGAGRTGDGDGADGDDGGSGGESGGAGGANVVEGGSRRRRRQKYPQVLLSGHDANPANPGETKHLGKTHPPLYQDDEDLRSNVWWINASHPFAAAALEHGGPQGNMFQSHQLFMFRDVVQREAMRMLQRREAEIAVDRLETELDEISHKFLGELPIDVVKMFMRDG